MAVGVAAAGAGLLLGAMLAHAGPLMPFVGGMLTLLGGGVAVLERFANSERRMTAAEQSYTAFFDHAIEGIFRTTVDGVYLDANPALAEIYGYESPEALMRELTNIAGQLYVDPSRREAFKIAMMRDDRVTDFVSEIRQRDGTHIWISENARAVRDWSGRIVFYEGTVEDVSAKIEAERVLQKALSEAETAGRVKNAFLAAMSHELKTPLNAVLGFSEILKGEMMGPLSNVYRDYANSIHGSGVKLLGIVNDVLDVARLQGGAVKISSASCILDPIVADAIQSARTLTNDNRPVRVQIPSHFPEIDVDHDRFRQLLANLVSNAFKFTPAKGSVSVGARVTDVGGVVISVADTGIGMEPDMVEQALEPFRQIDLSLARRFEGTGLGLSIVHSLVRLHGGTLEIDSRPAKGTTVRVILPPERVTATAKLEPQAAAM